MAERDGYLPGVPCWIDTSQPDPNAAAAFYSGLFGWETEDLTPPGSGAKYLVARLRGGDVAAISSPADGDVGRPTSSSASRSPSRTRGRRPTPTFTASAPSHTGSGPPRRNDSLCVDGCRAARGPVSAIDRPD